MVRAVGHAATPRPLPTRAPLSRMDYIDPRDGYGYSGGYKGRNHNAALSALALISFLFFLNLLQQQLSTGQQQTLLFMVNNTGRKKREVPAEPPPPPPRDLAAEEAEAFHHELLRKYLLGDKEEEEEELEITDDTGQEPEDEESAEESADTSSPVVPPLPSPAPDPAPPTEKQEEEEEGEWAPLAAWLRGHLPESRLPVRVAETLVACRGVVACVLHGPTLFNEQLVREVLAADGMTEDPGGGVREACRAALLMASDDCIELGHAFLEHLPSTTSGSQQPRPPLDLT